MQKHFKSLFGFVVAILLASVSYAQEKPALKEPRKSPPLSAESLSYRYDYKQMIIEEKRRERRLNTIEKTASGAAALAIGFYGYYFDSGNIGRRLAYSATQTAGVLMIGRSLQEAESPSFLLEMDRRFQEDKTLSYKDYRTLLVDIERQKKRATLKEVGYSSGLLSALYAYNSYYERNRSVPLRNVFGFLSVNFAAISAVSLYRLGEAAPEGKAIAFQALPYPAVVLYF